jgi:hypothetical protein
VLVAEGERGPGFPVRTNNSSLTNYRVREIAAGRLAACSPDNYVAILDLKTLEVAGHLDVAENPMGWPGRCGLEPWHWNRILSRVALTPVVALLKRSKLQIAIEGLGTLGLEENLSLGRAEIGGLVH